jgi:hypothetical protein
MGDAGDCVARAEWRKSRKSLSGPPSAREAKSSRYPDQKCSLIWLYL